MSALAKIFHLSAVGHFYFGLYYYVTFISEHDIKNRKYEYGGIFVYLTFLTFMLQAFYFTLALLNDFVGSNKAGANNDRPLITKVRDYIFGSFAFPLAFDVGGMFWLLYAIDRELVFPIKLDAFFPWWLNNFVHTNIMAFILIEMVILYHKYPCRKSGLAGIIAFMAGYLVWIHVVYYKANFWVYPVLAILNWPQRILFYVFTCSVPIFFYYFGEFINNVAWSKSRIGGEGSSKSKGKKSKKSK